MRAIKLCFFGAGSIIEYHINSFNNLKSVELFSILSRSKEKSAILKKKYSIKNIYEDYRDFKNIKGPKIAIIGVSVMATFDVCKKVFNYFDYCFIEKPPGYNFLEAKKIYNLSKKKKVKLFVGLNRRFFSSTENIVKLLKSDKSRRIVNILDYQNISNQLNFHPKKVLDNWHFANSIHLIDYINILCRGKILSVHIKKFKNLKDRIATLSFSSGDICVYQSVWNRPGPWKITLSNDTKYYKLEPLEELSYRTFASRKYVTINTHLDDIKFKAGFRNQAKNIISLIKKKKHGLVSIKAAIKTMAIINKIYT
jgi:predicted dehydrogenase